MSFLYPRVISLSRPAKQTGVGFQDGYAGDLRATETPIATNLPASIQSRRSSGRNVGANLPSDGAAVEWSIFIPKFAVARGAILQRDIVTDDLGERYQVTANYWDSLGFNLTAVKLQA